MGGVIEAAHVGYRIPGGRQLLEDVSFRVGEGERAALVGANGTGKTTVLRLVAGVDEPTAGTIAVHGQLGVMQQFVGSVRDATTVEDLMVSLAPTRVRAAVARLRAAEEAVERDGSAGAGIELAEAWSGWADAGGADAEVLWDTCVHAALRRSYRATRPVATLSGGEQKRLAQEVLMRGGADVLLLDEPDNYLDVPGKEWLEDALDATTKTVLFVSHDRELLARSSTKVVTLEGRSAWTHGASFATWREAREARLERLDEEHRRWREERRHLEDQIRELRRRSQVTDSFASRLRATKTQMRRHESAVPPERARDQAVSIRLAGGRTGKRAVGIEALSFPGLVSPFDTEVLYAERVGVLGLNGTGKSHFLRLLAGDPVEHDGIAKLGAGVVPGYFAQTNEHPDLVGRRVLDVLQHLGMTRGAAMAALRRYELQDGAVQPFDTLSGGQQARLQILQLELTGATLLLLDEPTDNLDAASAEALEDALGTFRGTVLAVTHDRWFMRTFDRFLVFRRDGTVTEELEPVWD